MNPKPSRNTSLAARNGQARGSVTPGRLPAEPAPSRAREAGDFGGYSGLTGWSGIGSPIS